MLSLFTLGTRSPPASGTGGYGITQAVAATHDVSTLVENRIDDAVATAKYLREQTEATLDGISNIVVPDTLSDAPTLPTISLNFSYKGTMSAPEILSFGEVSVALPTLDALEAIPQLAAVDIEDFTPSVQGFTLPQMPALPSIADVPDAPDIPEAENILPPSLTLPSMPALLELNVPAFDLQTLPVFTTQTPDVELNAVSTVLNWTEESYTPVMFDEMLAKVRQQWGEGLGLPPYIEHAMWERATERERDQVRRDTATAYTEFCARGFTRPDGVLASVLDRVRQEGESRIAGVTKELRVEVAKIHVQNMQNAIQNAVAAENVMLSLFNERANRMLGAAKAQIEASIAGYNAQVGLINAKITAFSANAELFRTRLNMILDVYKAQLEAAIAKGKINDQRLAAYSTAIQAANYVVSLYETQVKGMTAKVALASTRMDAYKTSVQAYAERVNMAKLPLDAYKVAVEAETAKTGLLDAEARAYAAMVSGRISKAEVGVKLAELRSMANEQKVRSFSAKLDAVRVSTEAQLASINAHADAFKASVSLYGTQLDAANKTAELEMTAHKYAADVSLASVQAQMGLYEVKSKIALAQVEQAIAKTKAIGDVASTLAAGAMAGVNVGANMSGTAQIVGSGSSSFSESLGFQQSVSEDQGYNENVSYSGKLPS